MNRQKIIIYQIFTRLFGNHSTTCKENGTIAENGCGKMNFFNSEVLSKIKAKGVTHIWYTGLIRHATAFHASTLPLSREKQVRHTPLPTITTSTQTWPKT